MYLFFCFASPSDDKTTSKGGAYIASKRPKTKKVTTCQRQVGGYYKELYITNKTINPNTPIIHQIKFKIFTIMYHFFPLTKNNTCKAVKI